MRKYLAGEHHPQQALAPRVMWMATAGGSPIGYIAGHLTRRFDKARSFYGRHGAVDFNQHWMVWNDISGVVGGAQH